MSQNRKIETRVDARTKAEVEKILKRTGFTMSRAIRIYLQKIIITNGMPFEIKTRRKTEEEFQKMTPQEIIEYLQSLTPED